MQARTGARWFAPIALIAAIAALYVIVHGQLNTGHTTTSRVTGATVATSTSRSTSTTPGAASVPRTYTVKANDTYSSIAQKTGVSVARLEALNPSVSANSLHLGERIVVQK